MTTEASVERVFLVSVPGARTVALFEALDGTHHGATHWQRLQTDPEGDPVTATQAALRPHAEALRTGRAAALAVYPEAAGHVAAALSEETGPAAALARWHDLARGLLGLRRQVEGLTLAPDAAVMRAPMSFLQKLSEHLSVARPEVEIASEDPVETSPADPFTDLVARAAIGASPAARTLGAELAARGLTAGTRGQGPELDLDDLWARRHDGTGTAQAELEAAMARIDALEGIEAELAELRETLEARETELEQTGQILVERDAELAELALIERLSHQQQAMIDLQAERLADLQRRSDDQTVAQERAEADLRDRERELERLRGEADHFRRREAELMSSTSWRITRPLRGLRNAFRRG